MYRGLGFGDNNGIILIAFLVPLRSGLNDIVRGRRLLASALPATVLRPWLDVEPDAELPGPDGRSLGSVAALLAALGPDATAGLRRRDDLVLAP